MSGQGKAPPFNDLSSRLGLLALVPPLLYLIITGLKTWLGMPSLFNMIIQPLETSSLGVLVISISAIWCPLLSVTLGAVKSFQGKDRLVSSILFVAGTILTIANLATRQT